MEPGHEIEVGVFEAFPADLIRLRFGFGGGLYGLAHATAPTPTTPTEAEKKATRDQERRRAERGVRDQLLEKARGGLVQLELYSMPNTKTKGNFFIIGSLLCARVLTVNPEEVVTIWELTGEHNQQWFFDGKYLRNRHIPKKVLDIDMTRYGNPPAYGGFWEAGRVILKAETRKRRRIGWEDPTPPHPVWTYEDNTLRIKSSYNDNIFLDIVGGYKDNGTAISVSKKHERHSGQKWQLFYV